jgi:pectate lyase
MNTTSLKFRRRFTAAAAFGIVSSVAHGAGALPAFPGAEGFGAVATGGRGGKVIKVTTLASSGPGSLKSALDQSGPRIIVFDVSGVIQGDVTIPHGDVTIAGQTAPGGGITIAGRLFGDYDDSVQNIIVRFVRVRPSYGGQAGNQFDAMQFSLNSRLIFDHVSISWGVDETVDLYEADDVTIQWSTIESSATQGHPEGQHNYGMINGPDGHRITVHHNLFAHHKNRNPAIANGPADVRNNVAYNVRHGFIHHNSASGSFNIVGNTYIQGPNDSLIPFYFDGGSASNLKYFMADNYVDDPGDYVGAVDDPWANPVHSSFDSLGVSSSHRSATEFDFAQSVPGYAHVTTQGATAASALVVAKAGAFPRDVVTLAVLDDLAARTGSWGVHEPDDLMEGLTPASPPPDADGDGMPDAWEAANGLDPNDGGDSTTTMPSGYTAIEEYVNCRAHELVEGTTCLGGGTSSSSSGAGGAAGAGGGDGSGAAGGGSGAGASPGVGGASPGGTGGDPGPAGTGSLSSAGGGFRSDDAGGSRGCACATDVPAGAPSGAGALLAFAALSLCSRRGRRT